MAMRLAASGGAPIAIDTNGATMRYSATAAPKRCAVCRLKGL
jgi:hypothetical protein